MSTPYPVVFDVDRPAHFQRAHVALRLLILIALGWLGASLGAIFALAYLLLPILAAVLIANRGSESFLLESAVRLRRWISWFVQGCAYLMFLTDTLPGAKDADRTVRFEVEPGGEPTIGSAMMRLLKSFPEAFLLAIVGIFSLLVAIIAAIGILIGRRYGEALYDFQRGVLRWGARLLAYHASLVERLPPVAISSGHEGGPQHGPLAQ